MSETQLILIVDDIPENIHFLYGVLKEHYKLKVASDGEKALKIAQGKSKPDLILLDIMMPGMDGYEVCSRLKVDKNTRDIPIIFVTAKNTSADEAEGLSLGAVDYITKPVKADITLARIRTQLELSRIQKQLVNYNQQLIETAKLKADVEHITNHDMKSPINGIIGFTELLLTSQSLSSDDRELTNFIKSLAYQSIDMVNLSLGLLRMEKKTYQLNLESVDLIALIQSTLSDNASSLKYKKIAIELKIKGSPVVENDTVLIGCRPVCDVINV